jgi:hypothetical protein
MMEMPDTSGVKSKKYSIWKLKAVVSSTRNYFAGEI